LKELFPNKLGCSTSVIIKGQASRDIGGVWAFCITVFVFGYVGCLLGGWVMFLLELVLLLMLFVVLW